jgi:Tol biopolymer transport system component
MKMRTVFLLIIILNIVAFLPSIGAKSFQTRARSTESAIPLREAKIAFVSNEQLYIMNADGSNAIGLTDKGTPIFGGYPTWSPDGNQLAFEQLTEVKAEIWVVNVDGSNAHSIHQSGRFPAWSPDGQRIAFSSGREGLTNLYVTNPDGSNLVRLTGSQGGFAPVWSPDGQRILFSVSDNGHIETYILNRDGSDITKITNNASAATDYDSQFSWSPDGKKIAFKSARTGRPQIYVMDVDGSNVVPLTNTFNGNWEPAWSPDGKYIAFSSDRGGPSNKPGTDGIAASDIYVMNADGTNPIRVTTSALGNFAPVWKP